MPNLFHQTFNGAFAACGDRFKSASQFFAKIGRHADGFLVQIKVPIPQSFSFRIGEVCPRRKRFQFFNQEFMSFHLAQFHLRIKSCRVPIERIGELFRIVPVKGTERVDENSLPKVLTFGQGKLQLCDPLLLTQVWPLVTTVVDDASLRCSSVAWLYSPDLGTFPAKSPLFSGCTWQLFSGSEKSLLCEVHDGHRT